MPSQLPAPTSVAELAAKDTDAIASEAPPTPEVFNYTKVSPRLKKLISDWRTERDEVETNRLLRNVDLNPKKLRDEGKLLADETIIPVRTINSNIEREQPAYINYLKGSGRLAIFKCIQDATKNCDSLDSEFTRCMTYDGWDTPQFRTLDGAETHGLDYVEVVFDDTKPGHIAIEHIGKDNLYYNKDCQDLQCNGVLIRRYSFSKEQLDLAKNDYGFESKQCQKLIDKMSSEDKIDKNIFVYKLLVKYQKVVHIAWFCLDDCDDWLKTPAKLFLGRSSTITTTVDVPVKDPFTGAIIGMQKKPQAQVVDVDEPDYPIFGLVYKETEEQKLVRKKGRVFLDKHKQEGQTMLASSYLNALSRATKSYASVRTNDPGDTTPPKQLDTQLQNGGLYDKPLEFFHQDYPDPSILSGLQYFDTQNSQEAGQINFAANNRKDSRKTATEIQAANEQQAMLSSTQVSQYSSFLRSVYSFCWRIIQNRALYDKFTFLAVPTPILNPLTQQEEIKYVNNKEVLKLQYDVRPAGDVDVIQKQQKITQLHGDWAVFSQTALATDFLSEIIKLSYPEQADKWIAKLQSASANDKALVASMLQIIKTAITPQELATLPPQQQQQLQSIIASAEQSVASTTPRSSPQQPTQPQQQ